VPGARPPRPRRCGNFPSHGGGICFLDSEVCFGRLLFLESSFEHLSYTDRSYQQRKPRRGSGQAAAASRPGRRPGASVRRSTLRPMLTRSLAKPAGATRAAAEAPFGRRSDAKGSAPSNRPSGAVPWKARRFDTMRAGAISIVEVFTNTGFRRN
jgi:hypothetical protein